MPPIHLSIVIGTESAKMLRHPKEAAEAKDFSQNNANSQGYIYIHWVCSYPPDRRLESGVSLSCKHKIMDL